MKHRLISWILALGILLPLLVIFLPASPALAAPQLNVSPISGAKGTEITVTGTNFASYISDILHILFGGVEIEGSPLTVPDTGTFELTFTVPNDTEPGLTYVTVTDQSSTQLAQGNPVTVVASQIKIDPEGGIVGTTVMIYGEGLYADKSVTFHYLNNDAMVKMGVEVASPIGECTYSFTIPDSVSGSHQVIAQDGGGNRVEAYFEVIPSITLTPTSAAIGAEVSLQGTGFGFISGVTVYIDDDMVTALQTDEYGSFDTVFSMPDLRSGTYDIKAEDSNGNMDRVKFDVIAGIRLDKITGHIGEEVNVRGTGFVAWQPVAIGYDAAPVAEGVVDEKGAFSVNFNVPASLYGNHEVTASDGTNLVVSLFSVESVAPPTPKLILPVDGVKAESKTCFDWEDVTDPSGVTYTLQVATNADFSTVILEKTELPFSDYIIDKGEKLRSTKREAPYYWRIRAVDGAYNEGQWSSSGSFYIGFSLELPTWATIILLILGAALISFVSFKLGRRTAYYESNIDNINIDNI